MSRLNPMQSPSTSDLEDVTPVAATADLASTPEEEDEYMTAYDDDGGRSFLGDNGAPMSEYSNPMMVRSPSPVRASSRLSGTHTPLCARRGRPRGLAPPL